MKDLTLPPLNWLRAFEASARMLSFTAAAHELHMSQPAVSQQVKALEVHLGRALFVRRTRSLQLTQAGQNYLPTVQQAFNTLGAGTRALIGGDRGKVLTIHCNLAFSVLWLAPRLAALQQIHPWLVLNVVTMIWDPKAHTPAAEIEIRFGPEPNDRKNAVLLSKDHCFPVASPRLCVEADSWTSMPLFDCAGVETGWDHWFLANNSKMPTGKIINLASTYSVTIMAAAHCAGISLGHDTLVAGMLDTGQLVKPFETDIEMAEAYYLLPPAAYNETPASRAFTAWLLDCFDAPAI